MKVMRVDSTGEATYDVQGLTEDDMVLLAALADYPLWGKQPKEVAGFCEALHNSVAAVLPEDAILWAESHGMTPDTTV